MTSVNTNIAAMTALRTLQATNSAMEETQNRVSTGLKIGSAKDNAAYWSIATTLQSDNKSLATVKDALGLGAATVDTAYEGLTQIKSVLDEIKSKLTLAQSQGVNRDTIQKEIADLQANIRSIADSSSFSGENWLSIDSSTARFQPTKQVVSSFSRDVSGSITIGTIDVDITKSALFDANTQTTSRGILDSATVLKDKNGKQLAIGGVATAGNTNAAGLTELQATGGKQNAATVSSITDGRAASTNTTSANETIAGGGYASFETSILALTGSDAVKLNDKLTFSINLDGAGPVVIETGVITSTSSPASSGPLASGNDIAKAIQNAIGRTAANTADTTTNGLGPNKVAVTFQENGKLQFTVRRDAGAAQGATSTLVVRDILNTTGKAAVSGLNPATLASNDEPGSVGDKGKFTTDAALNADTPAATRIQTGDTVSFFLNVDNTSVKALTFVMSKAATADGVQMSRADIKAAVTAAIANSDDFRGKVTFDIDGSGKAVFESTSVGTSSKVDLTGFVNGTLASRTHGIAALGDPVGGESGTNSTASVYTTELLNSGAAGGSIKVGDKLTMEIAVDGRSPPTKVNITTDAIAGVVDASGNPAAIGTTANVDKILRALQDALGSSSLNGKVSVIKDPGGTNKFVFRNDDPNSLSPGLQVFFTNAASNARDGGVSKADIFTGTGSASPVTGYAVKTGDLSIASLANGDVVTIKYTVGGTAREAKVSLATGNIGSVGALATQLATADLAGAKLAAENGSSGSASTQRLVLTSFGTDAAGVVALTDISVAGSDGVVKNVAISAGLTASTSGAAKTAALSWAPMAANDKVRLGLTVDGTARAPVTANAGGSVTDFVNNLNTNTEFARYASASKNGDGELVITSKTSGTTSKVSIDQVAFFGADGVQQFKENTGFFNTVSKVQAKSSDFSTFTLDKDDTLSFNVKLDGGSAKAVTIDKALVDATLGASANGKVATVEDYKAVLQAGLTAAGVTGLNVAVGRGTDASKLVFTNTDAKANSELFISDVVASAGGREISVDKIDISTAGLTASGATDEVKARQVLSAYVDLVDAAIEKVKTAASGFGSVSSRIDTQSKFVTTLMDTIEKGIGNLVDADMSEESTKLQALQVKQQLGVQALSMANQTAQQVLRLFQ